jgi:galactonate dehydratase
MDRREARSAAGILMMTTPPRTPAAERTACRITKVTTHVVGMRWRNCVFAHVETDDGIAGIGEGSLEYQPEAVAAAIMQLAARYAIGRSAFAIEKLWHDVLRNEFMHGPIINSAAAALEMAMWDIVGKALGRPVYDLLGGPVHAVLPAYANAWYAPPPGPAEIGRAAAAVAAKGYRGLKFDPFEDAGRDPERKAVSRAIDIVAAVRDAVGPDVDLMIDAHGRFSPGSAIAIARDLEPYDLFWFEEPCDPENVGSLAAVGRNIKTRLATGERCTSRALVQGLLESHEVDVLQPDIIHVGGILEAKKIAAMADACYVPVSFHNPFGPVATAAAVQLDACTTNIIMQESFCEYDVGYRFDLVEHAPRPEGGRYHVPDRPGLGIGEFVPEAARAHPFEPDAFLPLFTDRWSSRF